MRRGRRQDLGRVMLRNALHLREVADALILLEQWEAVHVLERTIDDLIRTAVFLRGPSKRESDR